MRYQELDSNMAAQPGKLIYGLFVQQNQQTKRNRLFAALLLQHTGCRSVMINGKDGSTWQAWPAISNNFSQHPLRSSGVDWKKCRRQRPPVAEIWEAG